MRTNYVICIPVVLPYITTIVDVQTGRNKKIRNILLRI